MDSRGCEVRARQFQVLGIKYKMRKVKYSLSSVKCQVLGCYCETLMLDANANGAFSTPQPWPLSPPASIY